MNESENIMPKVIPSQVIDLLVTDIFRKNGITEEEIKNRLTEDQKNMIKEMVENISKQVDSYINQKK